MNPANSPISVSIIICSRNRSIALKQTLDAFQNVAVPVDWKVELVVVDNASRDDTAEVVRDMRFSQCDLRYYYEPKNGKGHALNAGVLVAQGEVLLFTDDDVIPSRDWIERLALPLFRGEADAVGGKILLAAHLSRPWLTENYQRWLAWCEHPFTEPLELIGANMGLSRHVLDRVPSFDPELGPGAAGLGEDTLFGWRVAASGLRIKFVPEAVVIHHPDVSRLRRASWLGMAQSHGRKEAYILHHWKHGRLTLPRLRSFWLHTKLAVRRLIDPPVSRNSEGCAWWEMSYVGDIEMCRAYRRERAKPRNYPKAGKPGPEAPATGGS